MNRLINYLLDLRDRQRINIALCKGAAMMSARKIDFTRPATWEFSGFSQNGEDGILDVLQQQLSRSNRYFIEIGTSDGIECNSAWLVVVKKFNGMMIEGNPRLAERGRRMIAGYSTGVECHSMFVTQDSMRDLKSLAFHSNPDVFSLDIDGNDFYIARAVLDSGFRPKIFVVEYNSVYGPKRSITIEYQKDFIFKKAHWSELYYGVSIAGWRNFFQSNGYHFVTVDQNGVNAFFVEPSYFDAVFLNAIKGLEFAENQYQLKKYRKSSEEQFSLIMHNKYVTI